MVKLLNFAVPVLISFLLIVLIYIIYAIIKRKKIKYLMCSFTILMFISMIIVAFYFPVHIKFSDHMQLFGDIQIGDRNYRLEDSEQIDKIKKIIEEHRYIRNVAKTLEGPPPTPADQPIYIHVNGKNISYSLYIFVRKDSAKYSFIERQSQYYTIYDEKNFQLDIIELVSQLKLQ